jgi:hypothetical protein
MFFLAVEERRRYFCYKEKAVLLLDDLGAHHTDRFLDACSERNIKVVSLILQSSDQIQPLDLMTFALLKQHYSSSKSSRLARAQSNQVVCILSAWFTSSAPHQNVEALMNAGIVPEKRDGVPVCTLNRGRRGGSARAVRERGKCHPRPCRRTPRGGSDLRGDGAADNKSQALS